MDVESSDETDDVNIGQFSISMYIYISRENIDIDIFQNLETRE